MDELAFLTQPDYNLFDSPVSYLAQIFSPSAIIAVISAIISVLLFIKLRRLHVQVDKLSVLIAHLNYLPGTKASPTFYLPHTSVMPPGTPAQSHNLPTLDYFSYTKCIAAIITIMIVFYMSKRLFHKIRLYLRPNINIHSSGSFVLLELSNMSKSVTLCAQHIAIAPNRVKYMARKPICSIEVKSGLFRSFLHVEWRAPKLIIDDDTIFSIPLPSKVPIPLGMSSTCRQIIDTRYVSRLLIGNHPIFAEIPLINKLDDSIVTLFE